MSHPKPTTQIPLGLLSRRCTICCTYGSTRPIILRGKTLDACDECIRAVEASAGTGSHGSRRSGGVS